MLSRPFTLNLQTMGRAPAQIAERHYDLGSLISCQAMLDPAMQYSWRISSRHG